VTSLVNRYKGSRRLSQLSSFTGQYFYFPLACIGALAQPKTTRHRLGHDARDPSPVYPCLSQPSVVPRTGSAQGPPLSLFSRLSCRLRPPSARLPSRPRHSPPVLRHNHRVQAKTPLNRGRPNSPAQPCQAHHTIPHLGLAELTLASGINRFAPQGDLPVTI